MICQPVKPVKLVKAQGSVRKFCIRNNPRIAECRVVVASVSDLYMPDLRTAPTDTHEDSKPAEPVQHQLDKL